MSEIRARKGLRPEYGLHFSAGASGMPTFVPAAAYLENGIACASLQPMNAKKHETAVWAPTHLGFERQHASSYELASSALSSIAHLDVPRGWGWLRSRITRELASIASAISRAAAWAEESRRAPLEARAIELAHGAAANLEQLTTLGGGITKVCGILLRRMKQLIVLLRRGAGAAETVRSTVPKISRAAASPAAVVAASTDLSGLPRTNPAELDRPAMNDEADRSRVPPAAANQALGRGRPINDERSTSVGARGESPELQQDLQR